MRRHFSISVLLVAAGLAAASDVKPKSPQTLATPPASSISAALPVLIPCPTFTISMHVTGDPSWRIDTQDGKYSGSTADWTATSFGWHGIQRSSGTT